MCVCCVCVCVVLCVTILFYNEKANSALVLVMATRPLASLAQHCSPVDIKYNGRPIKFKCTSAVCKGFMPRQRMMVSAGCNKTGHSHLFYRPGLQNRLDSLCSARTPLLTVHSGVVLQYY